MLHHSFAAPLEHEDLLNDWMLSGASLFERNRMLVHPSVPDRLGFLWSKMPLLTNNFEVIVHFKVAGEQDSAKIPRDQSFAVWYVEENVTAAFNESRLIEASSWTDAMKDMGLTLSGYRGDFKGFGTVMSMATSPKAQPVFSYIENDGKRKLVYGTDLPAKDARAMDFRNTVNAAQLRIRVKPEMVQAEFKQSPSLSWNSVFKKHRSDAHVPSSGYLGFTAWSGSGEGVVPDMVTVTQVEVYNYDDTSIGEEMKDVSGKIQQAYWEMLKDENRHFIDQKSQTEHLKRLSTMLNDHVKASMPSEEKLFEELEDLEFRMSRLENDCKTVVKEVEILVNPTMKRGPGSMKDDIMGLRRMLVSDTAHHKEKISHVQKNLAEVKQKGNSPMSLGVIATHTEKLERTVQSRSSQMNWLLLTLVACVLAIGYLIWKRMRYYEKKHFI
eukprot:CAMPEP_0170649804 /NCGR_PEP_ID=MMETSP0224-20130122/45481_1 /TAXON_ID=285029 /ORGANISM="Togula jolla, Strain CCCM 725" /LENGTH=439 /DNA_ID=CAMNT_0010981457 /DNA_START=1 /DNA_END=1320 /DNA_ORIENTATION=+